jgi:ribosomal protein S18 acetylase RimI-like enzyme
MPDFIPTIPTEQLFSWESQVCQYPYRGEPGISYFPGPTSEGLVHCLLYRNEKGHVRGILNYYDFRSATTMPGTGEEVWEEPGNVNIWVHPKHQGRGIGTALWHEAVRRWGVTLEGQRFTAAGALFAQKLAVEGRKSND